MWCGATSCKHVPGHSCQEPSTKQDGAQHWQAISTLWCSFIFKLLGSLLVSGDVCSTYGGGVNRQSDYCPGDWHAACAPVNAWIQFSGESPFAWSSAVMTLNPSKSDFFLLMHEISKHSQYFFNFMRSLRGRHWVDGVPLLPHFWKKFRYLNQDVRGKGKVTKVWF